jgi:hypothetical protein
VRLWELTELYSVADRSGALSAGQDARLYGSPEGRCYFGQKNAARIRKSGPRCESVRRLRNHLISFQEVMRKRPLPGMRARASS